MNRHVALAFDNRFRNNAGMRVLATIAALLPAFVMTSAVAGERPARHFVLKYQDSDYVVPKGEQWELTWKTPYKPGQVVPAYDVRIKGGVPISMNRSRAFQVSASSPEDDGLLDISAIRKEADIRLPPGTEFEIASDLLKIQVAVYPAAP